MAYKDIRNLAVNQDNIATVLVAIIQQSIDVHAERLKLAQQVILSPESWAQKMIWAVALLAAGTSDAQVLATVKLIWNAYSGANAA